MEREKKRRKTNNNVGARTNGKGGGPTSNTNESGSRRSSVDTLNGKFSFKVLKRKKKMLKIIESRNIVKLMIVFTLWSLFSNDLRLAVTAPHADIGFEVVITIIFFTFLFEIIILSYCKPRYCSIPFLRLKVATTKEEELSWRYFFRKFHLGSFYFWLDCIATFSLLMEMAWVVDQTTVSAVAGLPIYQDVGPSIRAGARASRIIRIGKLMRVDKMHEYVTIHFMKTAKASIEFIKSGIVSGKDDNNQSTKGYRPVNGNERRNSIKKNGKEETNHVEQSRVGAAMTDLTNQRVTVIVILLVIIVPLLTALTADRSFVILTSMAQNVAVTYSNNNPNNHSYDRAVANSVVSLFQDSSTPVLSIQINGRSVYRQTDIINARRPEELTKVMAGNGTLSTLIIFDTLSKSQEIATLSMLSTLFILCVLLLGSYFFSEDINKLIINPIERLVDLVRTISANPLGVEYKMLGEKEGFMVGMETTVLLTTINRIGGLMQVGFGEAGASMIAKNLEDAKDGQMNFLSGGHMINSIFGFCDVRQFTDTTECLQEEVMLFVNRIAFILHDIVVQCSGSANKNIGDAFLLAWKLDNNISDRQITSLADQALLAFCKTLIELSRHQRFICNFSEAATERLTRRFPDYEIRIGSGLHVGWAIEGAIGSNRKIDASYLSPHVNFTEFLESSTKEYGVPLLFSEAFYTLLSPTVKRLCRQVDRIQHGMSKDPIGLFIYDFDLSIDWNDEALLTKRNRTNGFVEQLHHDSAHHRRRSRLPSIDHNTFRRKNSNFGRAGKVPLPRIRADVFSVNSIQLGGLSSSNTGHTPNASHHNVGRRVSSIIEESSATGIQNFRERILSIQTPSIPDLEIGGNGIPTTGFSDEGVPLSAKHHHTHVEYDPFAPPRISIPPYKISIWDTDVDLVDVRHLISEAYRQQWDKGFQAYVKGDWQKARDIFHITVRLPNGHEDGPSKFLINVIDDHGGTTPSNWEGFRDNSGGGH